MDSAIYCPYNKAVKIGFNFSVTKSVSVQEAAEIRNHFRNINEGINYKYKHRNSFDGAYLLDSVDII